jgi:Flp pilus assembly protein TadG
MKETMSKLRGRERGQSTVELALVMPLILIVLIGLFDVGRAWNVKQVVTDTTREAARTAALATVNSAWPADTCTKVVTARLAAAGITRPSGQPVLTNFRGASNGQVKVALTVPYRFVFLGPLLKWTVGKSTVNIATNFTMRIE